MPIKSGDLLPPPCGIACNVGRFATGFGVLGAGTLFAAMGGSYPKVGVTCGLIDLLGLMVSPWAVGITVKTLDECLAP